MSKPRSLSAQLALTMAMMVVAILIISIAVFYVAYDLLEYFNLTIFPDNLPDTSGWDLLILGVICMGGIVLALISAMRLSRRIVRPLHAVSLAAERIAEGKLGARADTESGGHGETRLLVDNFNTMAGRLEQMADDMLAWNAQIAHELRTPLTILKGRLQGAADGVFELDAAMIRSLLGQVEGLQRLVEDLRSVSLGDSGRLDLRIGEIDPATELEELAHLVEPGLKKAGFGLRMDLMHGRAMVDRARVLQAVMALFDNAQRYADPCELVLMNSFEDGALEIRVIDQGPGLPLDFADSAFQQFSRGRDSVMQHRSGSGLGLSVVRAIARAHGGNARYEADNGNSAFVISIPAAR
jgi:two-component system sensor histidine kinase AdeS